MTGRTANPGTGAIIADVAGRLRGRCPAVFLDFDGTLAEIVEQPEHARLDEAMREAVARLAARWPVAVISGRDLADIEARVGIEGVHYAGSHGFDIAAASGLRHADAGGKTALPALERAEHALRARLAGVDGVLVERKRYSIAVHFRRASAADLPQVEDAVAAVLDDNSGLRKGRGKKVLELRPDTDWDKGTAVRWLLRALDLDERPDVVPVYVGDDVTDEDAFRELAGDGIGIAVMDAPRPTLAGYRLPDPSAVRRLLQALAALPRED